jgi:hypothetical protein
MRGLLPRNQNERVWVVMRRHKRQLARWVILLIVCASSDRTAVLWRERPCGRKLMFVAQIASLARRMSIF